MSDTFLAEVVAKQEETISMLKEQVRALEEREINQMMSEGLVTHIAGQIQTLFSNPAMLSGITSAILQNLQNALVFRAGQSKERVPVIMVIKHYVPGAQRVTLDGFGVLKVEQQLEGSVGAEEGWELDETVIKDEAANAAIIELLQSYNIDADEVCYLIDDLSLQAHREDVSATIQAQSEHRAREQAIRAAQ